MLQTTHQLKAPFAAIHANAQLLLRGACGPLPAPARDVVVRVAARCAMLSQQVIDMLQLANLRSAGQTQPPLVELDLAQLIQSIVARYEAAATQRSIRIEADLQPCTIQAAEDHLRMLIDNLLSNAINYSREGGRVSVSCQRRPDGSAEASVRDEGIGIPAEKLPKIFADYYRTSDAARHNKDSTGLGLAIVRHVARLAGIRVRVESSHGQGSLFTLVIPPTSCRSRSLRAPDAAPCDNSQTMLTDNPCPHPE
jgi:signal transduction histidine kinase